MTEEECTWCGEELRYPDDPDRDGAGDPICERCWKEEFQFICAVCDERTWEGEEKERKQYIVIDNTDSPEPGIYRVTGKPFYTSNYFRIGYREQNLEKVAEITDEFEMAGRIVGKWVCFDCIKDIHNLDELRMMNHGNCLWCGRAGVTLMDGRFCGLCQSDMPEELVPEPKEDL